MKIDIFLNSKNRAKILENIYFRNYYMGKHFNVFTDNTLPDNIIVMCTIPVTITFKSAQEFSNFIR